MATKDVMIDIETLSTSGDALVLSIGMTPFECTPTGIVLGSTTLLLPDLVEQILLGRRIDRSTQLWWAAQPLAAQAHWRYPSETRVDLGACLLEFNRAFGLVNPDRVWTRGPHFDIAILDSLYQSMSMRAPWKYNSIRDVRTYCDDRIPSRAYTGAQGEGYPKHHPLQDNYDQIVDLWQHGLGGEEMQTPAPRTRDCSQMPAAPGGAPG